MPRRRPEILRRLLPVRPVRQDLRLKASARLASGNNLTFAPVTVFGRVRPTDHVLIGRRTDSEIFASTSAVTPPVIPPRTSSSNGSTTVLVRFATFVMP